MNGVPTTPLHVTLPAVLISPVYGARLNLVVPLRVQLGILLFACCCATGHALLLLLVIAVALRRAAIEPLVENLCG